MKPNPVTHKAWRQLGLEFLWFVVLFLQGNKTALWRAIRTKVREQTHDYHHKAGEALTEILTWSFEQREPSSDGRLICFFSVNMKIRMMG